MLLLTMIFCHIIDDFFIQAAWLVSGKQKSWWEKNVPPEKQHQYRNDYLMALFMHSFSWVLMIMLPIAYTMNFSVTPVFIVIFIANLYIHALVDNIKANNGKLNLVIDQMNSFHTNILNKEGVKQ